MATAAEPRPAELPLPGGRARAAVKLSPLLTGKMIGPPGWFLREEGRLAWRKALGFGVSRRDWLPVPVPAFLIEHPKVGAILIDTGFHPSVAVNPARAQTKQAGNVPSLFAFPWCLLPGLCVWKAHGTAGEETSPTHAEPRHTGLIQTAPATGGCSSKAVLEQPSSR